MKTRVDVGNVKSTIFIAAVFTLFVATAQFALAQSDSGWKQKWDTTLAQAKKEGKVVVFGPPGDRIREALTKGFAKAFPDITMEFSGARGGELAQRGVVERDAGIYSVDVGINGTSTANSY